MRFIAIESIYLQARSSDRNLCRKIKAIRLIEQHRSIQNSGRFYLRLCDVKMLFEAQVAMCRAKNGELLTN
jgi:hypothetical protein